MRKLPLIILISLSAIYLSAQTNLDSLWGVWNDHTQPDTSRLKAMHEIAWDGYLFTKPDSAFYFAQMEYDLSEKSGLKKQMSSALNTQGASFLFRGDPPQALGYFQRCLKIREEAGDKKGIGASLNNIGTIYQNQGDYPKALEHYQRSLKIFEETGDKKGTAYTFNNIGNIYKYQGDTPKALEHYQMSLKSYEEIGDKKGIAANLGNIGLIYKSQGDYPKALEYYQRSLKVREEVGAKREIANSLTNIGAVYEHLGDSLKALDYQRRSLKINEEIGDKNGIASSLINIGNIYSDQGDYPQALDYFQRSLKIYEETGDKKGIGTSLLNVGVTYQEQGDNQIAIAECSKSLLLAQEIGAIIIQRAACQCLYYAFKATGNGNKALEYHEQLSVLNDSLFNEENTKKLTQLEMQYEFDKQEAAAQLEQEKKDAIAMQELERQKLVRNGFMGGFAVVLLFAGVFFVQRNRIGKEKERSEELLLNILPAEVAEELKDKGHSDAQFIDQVTVLFTDFKGFTAHSEQLTPKELVRDLHECFSEFDRICEKYGIEKIKTIGDAYMAAGGLPSPNSTHAKDVAQAALEMAKVVERGKGEKTAANLPFFEVRIGVHTGPVVAGIVGVKKFQYDIWGDTVNTASRMESSGAVGQVNISEATYKLLKDDAQFTFESRGKIEAKGKGEMEMYFVSKA